MTKKDKQTVIDKNYKFFSHALFAKAGFKKPARS